MVIYEYFIVYKRNTFGLIHIKSILEMTILILSQTTNFRLIQTQRVYRQQCKLNENGMEFSKRVEHCGKRRHCSFQAISHFHSFFLKYLYCRHITTRACLERVSVAHLLQLDWLENTVGKGENDGY